MARRLSLVSLRFILTFVVLLVVFQVLFDAWISNTAAFRTYLHWNARISTVLLQWFGESAAVSDDVILSPSGSLEIRKGCDAIQPCLILVAGLLAFPATLKNRSVGLALGCTILLVLNLVRITSLYYVHIYQPQIFEVAHEGIWPAAFILVAMWIWVTWMLRVSSPSTASK